MLNPFNWRSHERAGLAAILLTGGALGIAFGFYVTHWRGMLLANWLSTDPEDAFVWAIVGAAVLGGPFYCWRMFTAK